MEVIASCLEPLLSLFVARYSSQKYKRFLIWKQLQRNDLQENCYHFLSLFDLSSLTSDFHSGEGYHKTHYLIGLAATRQSQRSHPGVWGQVLREGMFPWPIAVIQLRVCVCVFFLLTLIWFFFSGPKWKKLQNNKNFIQEHWHQRPHPPHFLCLPCACSYSSWLRGIQWPIWGHDQLWWVLLSFCVDGIGARQRRFNAGSVMHYTVTKNGRAIVMIAYLMSVSLFIVGPLIKIAVVNKRLMIMCYSTWLAI